jgi:predicted amidophosphoribosyltransferase
MRLVDMLADAAGFPLCNVCKYREAGSPALCLACAQRKMQPLPPEDRRCAVCDRGFDEAATVCRNRLCNDPDRDFEWNFAIAMREGDLSNVMDRYKRLGRRAWAQIFARLLVGFLDRNWIYFEHVDLIVASPSFVGEDGRSFDHTREVLKHADFEQLLPNRWPFDLEDPPAIIKTAASDKLAASGSFRNRRLILENQVEPALRVPRPERTQDKKILVYDDLFTTGGTLDAVARVLKQQGGAEKVYGITLARQKYRGP